MITIVIKPKLAGLLKALGKNAPAAVRRGLISGCNRGVAEMQNRTSAAKVFDRGTYRMRWKASETAKGARIYNDAPHAPIIEEGRRPGARMPPKAILERWAARRLGLSAKEAKAAAFPIARAIGRRGLPAKHLLRDAVPTLTHLVEQEVDKELRRAAAGYP